MDFSEDDSTMKVSELFSFMDFLREEGEANVPKPKETSSTNSPTIFKKMPKLKKQKSVPSLDDMLSSSPTMSSILLSSNSPTIEMKEAVNRSPARSPAGLKRRKKISVSVDESTVSESPKKSKRKYSKDFKDEDSDDSSSRGGDSERGTSYFDHEFTLGITQKQKDIVRNTWSELMAMQVPDGLGGHVGGCTKFYDELQTNFIQSHPFVNHIFGSANVLAQVKAWIKTLSMIVKSIDEGSDIKNSLDRIGVTHKLYGIKGAHLVHFANGVSESLQTVFGKTKFSSDAKMAWYDTIIELSDYILMVGRSMPDKGYRDVFYRKAGDQGQWKRSHLTLKKDILFIHRKNKSKFKMILPVENITSVAMVESSTENPSEYGIVVSVIGRDPLYLCTDDESKIKQWTNLINWHVQASLWIKQNQVKVQSA
eukprot:TRINITY_DN529_c0_g1_i3.p1 TRINITY_DN529_c0_g1~~TRINITY_DN529_c0_g1_i3.p1  ORF type:complete len:424 (-),score=64.61 TRINITY_DN529_c0_g1_i3:281-1552(-)